MRETLRISTFVFLLGLFGSAAFAYELQFLVVKQLTLQPKRDRTRAIKIQKNTILNLIERADTPSWAYAVKINGTKEIYYVDRDFFAQGTVEFDPLQSITDARLASSVLTNRSETDCPTCPIQPSSPAPFVNKPAKWQKLPTELPARDISWTYAAADRFVEDTNFDPSELSVIPRSEWGAREPKFPVKPQTRVEGIVIHHSASPASQGPKQFQNMHMDIHGWADIGYHYVVAKDSAGHWRIFEGRSMKDRGAHAGARKIGGKPVNLNPGQVGIVIAGNFEQRSATNPTGYDKDAPEYKQQPEPEAVYQLGLLIAKLKQEYPTISTLKTHGDGPDAINPGHTQCPGPGCTHIVSTMRRKFRL